MLATLATKLIAVDKGPDSLVTMVSMTPGRFRRSPRSAGAARATVAKLDATSIDSDRRIVEKGQDFELIDEEY